MKPEGEAETGGWVVSWGGAVVPFFGKASDLRAQSFAYRNCGAGAVLWPLKHRRIYCPGQLYLPGMHIVVVWLEEELERLEKGMVLFLERCKQLQAERDQATFGFIE